MNGDSVVGLPLTSLFGHVRGISMYADQLHAIIQCGGRTAMDRIFKIFKYLEKYEKNDQVKLTDFKTLLSNIHFTVGAKKYGGGLFVKGIKAGNVHTLFAKSHIPTP